jgi:manganese oxidase
MHSINGRVYANLDGLDMVVDDKVRWFIAAFGTEVCLYTLNCSI